MKEDNIIPDGHKNIKLFQRPHVVILGAGSSCAATPHAEAGKQRLPSMNALPGILKLHDILTMEQIESAQDNFEHFFSCLYLEDPLNAKKIEQRLYDYFQSLRLVPEITLYDKLVLSLRKKDLIATFNWDPLLGYAFRRNNSVKTLPHIVFLHGNVLQGVCKYCMRLGWNDDICDICKKKMEPVPLLYPVTQKDYTNEPYLKESWEILEDYLSEAYFITIFGYSAPFTDTDARNRIINAIKKNPSKEIMQYEIIDLYSEKLRDDSLSDFIQGNYVTCIDSFEKSMLTRHPRFSCEALFQATMMNDPIKPLPFPMEENLQAFQEWAIEINKSFSEFYNEGYSKQG